MRQSLSIILDPAVETGLVPDLRFRSPNLSTYTYTAALYQSNMAQDPTTLSQDYGGESDAIPERPWEWLTEAAKVNLDGQALVVTHQSGRYLGSLIDYGDCEDTPSAPHLIWTYKQVLSAVEVLASYFANQHDITKGDNVLVFADSSNVAEWFLLFWTTIRLGGVFVPLDPVILKQEEEMQTLLQALPPAVVVVQDGEQAGQFEKYIPHSLPKLKLACDEKEAFSRERGNSRAAWKPLQYLPHPLITDSAPPPVPEVDPNATALIMCTSGSTNLPKSCPISNRVLVTQTRQYHSLHRIQLDSKTRHLVVTAIFRPLCYLTCVNAWTAGGTVIFNGKDFDARNVLGGLEMLRVSHAWFVPAMINMLHAEFKQAGDLGEKATKGLRCVLMGGDTLTREIVEKGREMFVPGRTRFIPHWGMSEGAPLFGFVDGDGLEPIYEAESGIMGIGRALKGTTVKVVGEGGEVVGRGERGSLHVASMATVDHYLANRSENDFYSDDDGCRWFKTGDVAIMDVTGILYIVGRTKDIIKYKNLVLIPTVLEACLSKGFDGLEAFVVGLKDEVCGEVAAAVIKVLPKAAGKQEMMEYVWDKQGNDRGLDGGIWTLGELGMDDWPYNSLRKIQRKELVDAIERVNSQHVQSQGQ